MTTLTASQILLSARPSRVASIRNLFGHMADAARAAAARRAMAGMSEHLLRDIGLTRGDLLDL